MQNSSPILARQWWRHFRLSLSLSVSLSLSLSLSPNVPHAQYRKRFRASYNTECIDASLPPPPFFFIPLPPTATEMSKSLRNTHFKQQCCTYSRNPKTFWKLDHQRLDHDPGRSKNHLINTTSPPAMKTSVINLRLSPLTLNLVCALLSYPLQAKWTMLALWMVAFLKASARYLPQKSTQSWKTWIDSFREPGSDGIRLQSSVKHCASAIAPSVATLFNATIKTGHLLYALYCINPGNFSKLLNLVNWPFWRFISY